MTDAIEPLSPSLSSLPLAELVERLASAAPVPGGGSAAAVAGALGASLVGMVAELTIGKAAEPQRRELGSVRDEAATLRGELLALAQRDADAYDTVMRARRLPKASEEEAATRRHRLDEAMREAAAVPMATARAARGVLELAARIAPIGNPNAISDVGVAAQLSSAAMRGALLNVRINIPYLPADDPLRRGATEEAALLEAAAIQGEQEVASAVELQLGGASTPG